VDSFTSSLSRPTFSSLSAFLSRVAFYCNSLRYPRRWKDLISSTTKPPLPRSSYFDAPECFSLYLVCISEAWTRVVGSPLPFLSRSARRVSAGDLPYQCYLFSLAAVFSRLFVVNYFRFLDFSTNQAFLFASVTLPSYSRCYTCAGCSAGRVQRCVNSSELYTLMRLHGMLP